jgi:hypothetical protein
MTLKNYIILTVLILTTSACSLIPARNVEIVSTPIQIDILQPDLPRPVELTAPQWFVVSETKIVNPCVRSLSFEPKKFNEEGVEQLKRPKVCDKTERENPDWPDGYTYLDQFMDEMKSQNNGDILFVATTVGDYKVMAQDMQELKRYIKQLGEVVIYYRNVTINDEDAVGVAVKKKD